MLVITVLSTFGANTMDMSLLTVLARVEYFKVYHNSFPLIPTWTCFHYFLYQASLLTTYRHVVSILLLLFRDILDCSPLYCLFQSCAVIAQQHRQIQYYNVWSSPICSHSHISYTYRTHLSKLHPTLSTLFLIPYRELPHTFSLTLTPEHVVWQVHLRSNHERKKEEEGKKNNFKNIF